MRTHNKKVPAASSTPISIASTIATPAVTPN